MISIIHWGTLNFDINLVARAGEKSKSYGTNLKKCYTKQNSRLIWKIPETFSNIPLLAHLALASEIPMNF